MKLKQLFENKKKVNVIDLPEVGGLSDEERETFLVDWVKENEIRIYMILNPSIPVQISAVTEYIRGLSYLIMNNVKLTEEVLIAALTKHPSLITQLLTKKIPISDEIKTIALTSPENINDTAWLTDNTWEYPRLVRRLYPNNELMQRKWIRYGEQNRGQE